MLSFASREAEAVEEVEIVSEDAPQRDRDRNSDNAFHLWLRKDLKSAKDKQVDWKRKKRSVFDKMGYNDKHIPHQGTYPKNKKKQKLDQWDNPMFNWPPKIPPPTLHKGKTLLNHIDSEERKKIQKEREF